MDRRQFLLSTTAAVALAGCNKFEAQSAGNDVLGRLDGLGVAGAIRSREFTSLEATEAAIARVGKMNGQVNAVVTKTFDQALERAAQELSGPLGGVPYALKDLMDYEGVRHTNGSKLFLNNISDWTSPFVQALEASGLNIVGKTNTPEFGLLATTEPIALGACHNPWSLDHSTGGSSGGAAAMVASGMLPFAQASDGGGSIRIPASCCGVFGMKPSRGRMMQSTQVPMPADIGVRHCVSRSVRDSAFVHSITEDRGTNAVFTPTGYVQEPSTKRLKIAFGTKNYLSDEPDADVMTAIEETAQLCIDLGHEVIYVATPVDGQLFIDHFLTVWASGPAQLKALVEQQTGQPAEATDLLESWTLGLADFFNAKPAEALSDAIQHFQAVTQEMTTFMSGFDVWLTPVLKSAPPKLGEQGPNVAFDTLYDRVINYVSYTPLHNATGMPAMSVPLSWNADSLPIGSQFVANLGQEGLLYALAYELETARPWAEKWAPHSIMSV